MIVAKLLKLGWAEKRPVYSYFLGVFFTLVAFATSYLLFRQTPQFIGVATILFTVILVVPLINRLFDREENYEIKEGLSFFVKHESIIDFFVYFFLGVFTVFLVLASVSEDFVLSEEQLHNLQAQQPQADDKGLPPLPVESQSLGGILKNNFYVLGISFFLSLFYGAGALFLITLNASIFAVVFSRIINGVPTDFLSAHSYSLCHTGILFLHMVPEIVGYLCAAIAGGILSHAIFREKFGKKNFRIVLIDSLLLLVLGIIILTSAGVIEHYISGSLLEGDFCTKHENELKTAIPSLSLIALVIIEYVRKKHTKGKRPRRKKLR